MASIPGFIYLIVGGAVMAFSHFVMRSSESASMKLFFWVGGVLLVVGVFKILVKYMVGKGVREVKVRESEIRDTARESAGASHILCGKCGAKLHPRSRYCNWCGGKITPKL